MDNVICFGRPGSALTMGYNNRDYMQEDYGSRGQSWGHDIPTCKWLLIVSVIVFFLQTLMIHDPGANERHKAPPGGLRPSYIEDWFGLDDVKVMHGQVWRLASYVFLHNRESPFGLVFNMLIVYFFGGRLERMYGSREILSFYLAAGLVTGLIFTAFGLWLDLPFQLIGSDAGTMAMFTLYAIHFPYQEILFCWIVPVQIRVILIVYALLELFWVFQAYSGQRPLFLMAYSSQLWGIVFGYLYRRMNWRLSAISQQLDLRMALRSWRNLTARRSLKVFEPEPQSNLDEQVDAILAKIHEKGSESLTDRERHILQQASEQAKNRH